MYTKKDYELDKQFEIMLENRIPDFDEDDLYNMPKEEFCKTYRIPEEKWDMLQKEIQEM